MKALLLILAIAILAGCNQGTGPDNSTTIVDKEGAAMKDK